jgi:hypothetical protein
MATGACGSRVEPADRGAIKGDAGPALRGHVGDDGGGGALDAESDLSPAIDTRPVIDATVPVDAITTTDVPPVIDANRADTGKPDSGKPDTGPPDTGPPDVTPDVPPRACTAPAKRCVDLVPQTCDASGAWQSGAACPFLCVAGACAGVCAPGSNQCVGGDLQICDAGGAWQSTGTSRRELLINPAFDVDLNEAGWTNPGIQIVYAAPAPGGGVTSHPDVAAQSLPNLAWFGGLDSADDRLSQSIAIPAGASNLTVSFFYAVVTGKTGIAEADTFDASLLAGAQVISLAHLSNLNATDTWTPVSVTLPAALAGQTVTLQLRGVTNTNVNRTTSFYIDTMSFSVVVCP